MITVATTALTAVRHLTTTTTTLAALTATTMSLMMTTRQVDFPAAALLRDRELALKGLVTIKFTKA